MLRRSFLGAVGALGTSVVSAPAWSQASSGPVSDLKLVYGFTTGGTVEAVLQVGADRVDRLASRERLGFPMLGDGAAGKEAA